MILYIDCVGGVAGDMLLAALVDAGASLATINGELDKLGVPGLRASVERVERHSINCAHIKVTWEHPPHEHHAGDEHQAHGRAYARVRELIVAAGLAPRVTGRALAAFEKLAVVEAHIHGVAVDDVHFHEVGSEDSIADVVGVAVALELLGIDDVFCSPLPLGRGFVRGAHGVLPLPAPATLALLVGVPVHGVEIDKELVTPTGAALVVTLASGYGPIPAMSVSILGYGAGGRDLAERPNVVRVLVGTSTAATNSTEVVLVETNLDDCSPELIPDAAAAAMRAGALDVWTSPVTMKKGRPGFVLHAIARRSEAQAVGDALLRETSALGVRMCAYERVELDRTFMSVPIGTESVRVKIGLRDGRVVNIAPEHDDCAAVAETLGLPVKEVFAQALVAVRTQLDEQGRSGASRERG